MKSSAYLILIRDLSGTHQKKCQVSNKGKDWQVLLSSQERVIRIANVSV